MMENVSVEQNLRLLIGAESQTIDHLTDECKLLEMNRNELRKGLGPRTWNWPIPRGDVIQLYKRHFILGPRTWNWPIPRGDVIQLYKRHFIKFVEAQKI
ncbi:hypothetical protein QE152_g8284 [Popillia japonica]|uniref:Uncharacterized protein n=1 Tax=Popillia japonica TaxID=7064 RepID=A0AAW1MBU1_POPJA